MSRAQLTSTVEQNTGGAVAPVVGYKNFATNGAFDIWQRGTSFAATSSAQDYTADRWKELNNSGLSTYSRQATSDTTNLPFVQYCMRVQRNSGQTATGAIYVTQSLESVNSIPLAGKTVTFSFYARAGANFSATSNVLSTTVSSGTGTDQNINGGFTGTVNVVNAGAATLTTTWQRFSFTGTVGSTATQLGFYFFYTPTGTAGANDYFEVTGVQLEQGAVATPFSRAAGTLQGELALCQYYFNRIVNGAEQSDEQICVLQAGSSTSGLGAFKFGNTMRVAPTVTISSASHFGMRGPTFGGPYTCSSLTFASISKRGMQINTVISSGVLTAGYASVFEAPSASATLDLSAEL